MTTFETRLASGSAHEANVLTLLRMAGWDAEPFGQGQLTAGMRTHLRRYTPITPIRWMPDIIAGRVTNVGIQQVIYVDAKAGERWRDTGNHDVETAALETATAWEAWTKCPVHYVFADFKVVGPERIWECGTPGPHYGNGSGTPYLLFPTDICEWFSVKFGPLCPLPPQVSA